MTKRIAVAALIEHGGEVLLCLGEKGQGWHADAWELPGGEIQQGESHRDSLRLLIAEKLGVTATLGSSPWRILTNDDERVDVWRVTNWTGTIRIGRGEHLSVQWVRRSDIAAWQLGHLAQHLCVSPDRVNPKYRRGD